MKLVVIIGAQAVGKMTVGQELQKLTGLRLFHNHMTIELVRNFFDYSTPEGKRLVQLFRREIFEAVSKSDLPGLIFTYVCPFNVPSYVEYLENLCALFESRGADSYIVELFAPVEIRLERNVTPNRLAEKPSKRDTAWTQRDIISSMEKYRLVSEPGEITMKNYLRIDNSNLSPEEAAQIISDFISK